MPVYTAFGIFPGIEVTSIYKCLCDPMRLRILNLLREGPLCVCHLQEILGEAQVKTSKHLGYMRRLGLIAARRENNWTIYSLPARPHPLLAENLKCLQDCRTEMRMFRKDQRQRTTLLKRLVRKRDCCPDAVFAATEPLNTTQAR